MTEIEYTELPTEAAHFYRDRITVSPPRMSIRLDGSWHEATVNWFAIGATDPKTAYEFAQGMMQAAMLAAEWNRAFKAKMDTASTLLDEKEAE